MEKGSNSFKVLNNLSWISSSIVIERIGTLVFSIIIARLLMPEGFGIYNLAISTAMVLITFTDLGVNAALTKYLTDSIQKKNYAEAKAYFVQILKLKLILAGLTSIALLILAYPLSIFLYGKPELIWPLFFCGFYILIITFEGFLRTFFYVYNKLNYFALKEIIYAVLRLVLIGAIFFVLPREYYVSALIIGLSLISLCVLVYYLSQIRKFAPFVFEKQKRVEVSRAKILRFVTYLTIGSISTIVLAYIDTIVLGIYLPAEYVGYYRAAFGVVLSISGLLAFSNVLLPFFVRLREKRLKEGIVKSLRYSALITIPAAFGMAALGRYFVVLLFGYDYLPATIPLFILSFLIFESINSSILAAFYTAKEKLRFYTYMVVFSTILNIVLNFVAVLTFKGISFDSAVIAASVATLISRYVFFLSLYYHIKGEFELKIPRGIFAKPIMASLIMFMAIYGLNLLLYGKVDAVVGGLEVIGGALVYGILIILFRGIYKKDYTLFRELIRIKFKS